MGRLRASTFGKFVFAIAFCFSTLAMGLGADAGVSWCESDPLFVVNGRSSTLRPGFRQL